MAPQLIRFTNGQLAQGNTLTKSDLYIDTSTGKITNGQDLFFSQQTSPIKTIDLHGQILAPGFIDVQINGCYGLDFSLPSTNYASELARVKQELVKTGVTSFLPTLTSQAPAVYAQTLPFLGADQDRNSGDGAESLGAHCEGPFINPLKCGIHKPDVLQTPTDLSALETCYGKQFLTAPIIKMITIAPELTSSPSLIPDLHSRGIVISLGHSAATHDQASTALSQGATMLTHLYNAMPQPHHRDTGIVGLLGSSTSTQRPYYGLIADGYHVSPSMARLAYKAHSEGCCLVTDAMSVLGLPDGRYPWTNGEYFLKTGNHITLERTGGIAGSAVTLVDCVNNLLNWTENQATGIAEVLQTVTGTPAKMLGLDGVKGSLNVGADADLVVLSKNAEGLLVVEQVWKFGRMVFTAEAKKEMAKARL
ncbi:MAG: hypothetical protein GOMPHAMPRED_003712 [Gomphillus americanus]|uniref:N-acetylglucosamine-6-phosphate deacetylase n=1 Tax=Gomphillus americanus TaxID=1940652 RepID=A0A8H3FHV6_9LECA|nr:MAG: hypothetical protein GOMPHAMPRED_003712 [Gomphillus americanus]